MAADTVSSGLKSVVASAASLFELRVRLGILKHEPFLREARDAWLADVSGYLADVAVIDDPIDVLAGEQNAPSVPSIVKVLRIEPVRALTQHLIAARIAHQERTSTVAERKIYEALFEILTEELRPATRLGPEIAPRDINVAQWQSTSEAFRRIFDVIWEALRRVCRQVADVIANPPMSKSEPIDWAQATLASLVVDSLDGYLRVLQTQPRAEDTFSVEEYRIDFARLNDTIPVPDLGSRRHEPYQSLFVDPGFEARYHESELSLGALGGRIDRTVVLGDPGAGKSTVSRILSVIWAERHGPVFLLPARLLQVGDAGLHLVREIERLLSLQYHREASAGMIERLLMGGSALLVLDGLDEVDSLARRMEVTRAVEIVSHRYPLCRILVTARSIGYDAVRLDPKTFSEVAVKRFARPQVEQYVTNWFRLDEKIGDALPATVQNFMETSDHIHDLRRNPLMLSYICVLYRGHNDIPRRRTHLYRKCVELLLRDWDMHRGVNSHAWEVDDCELALIEIAYVMFTQPEYSGGLTEQQLQDMAARNLLAELVPSRQEAERLARELIELCRGRGWLFTNVGLDGSGDEVFSFIHRSLMEYFAAQYIIRQKKTPGELSTELLPQVLSLRGEVLSQMCVNLAGQKWAGGSSQTLIDLLRSSRTSPEKRDSFTVLEFAVNAADSVPLNESAITELLNQFTGILGQPNSRTLAKLILHPNYRHANSVPDVLANVLRKRIVDDRLRILTQCDGASWLWDFCLQQDLLGLSELHKANHRDLSTTFERLFSGALFSFTEQQPICSALWLMRSAFLDADRAVRLASVQQLAALGELAGDLSSVAEINDSPPVLPTFSLYFPPIIRDVERALRKAAAQRPQVLGGVTLLALGLCEYVIAQMLPAQFPSSGVVAGFLEARRTAQVSTLPDGLRALDPGILGFVHRWARGESCVFSWGQGGQAVS